MKFLRTADLRARCGRQYLAMRRNFSDKFREIKLEFSRPFHNFITFSQILYFDYSQRRIPALYTIGYFVEFAAQSRGILGECVYKLEVQILEGTGGYTAVGKKWFEHIMRHVILSKRCMSRHFQHDKNTA